MDTTIQLTCKSIWYYSQIDEDLFFEWINRIPSIIGTQFAGDILYLKIKSNNIPDDHLRELLALFYKYKINMSQLKVFLNNNNKNWFFDNPNSYWHKKVFKKS